jgi:hypothetical protein
MLFRTELLANLIIISYPMALFKLILTSNILKICLIREK